MTEIETSRAASASKPSRSLQPYITPNFRKVEAAPTNGGGNIASSVMAPVIRTPLLSSSPQHMNAGSSSRSTPKRTRSDSDLSSSKSSEAALLDKVVRTLAEHDLTGKVQIEDDTVRACGSHFEILCGWSEVHEKKVAIRRLRVVLSKESIFLKVIVLDLSSLLSVPK